VKEPNMIFWMLLAPFHRLTTHLSCPKALWQEPQKHTVRGNKHRVIWKAWWCHTPVSPSILAHQMPKEPSKNHTWHLLLRFTRWWWNKVKQTVAELPLQLFYLQF
jgi:hypothetical protein